MSANFVISIFKAQSSRFYHCVVELVVKETGFMTAGASVRHQHLPGHRLGQAGP
jgi:hypothetical protein